MGYKAMLTLDLENGVSSEKRRKFYEHLSEKQWAKLSNLTTTWKCSFKDNVTRDSAITTVKNDVASAARSSGVSTYHAAVQLAHEEIVEF